MGLPQSREKTYGPNDPVSSSTTNKLQDCAIGGKHGLITRLIPAIGANGNFTFQTAGNTPSWKATANAQLLYVPLHVYVGERIVNVRGIVQCGATDVIAMTIEQLQIDIADAAFPPAVIAGPTSSAAHANQPELISFTGLNQVIINDAIVGGFHEHYTWYAKFLVTAFATAPYVIALELDVDCPP